MTLDDQLRAVLNEEADLRTATRPDVQGMIRGGRARRRRRNAVRAAGTVLAAVIAAGGVYGLAQLADRDADSTGPITDVPSAQPLPDIGDGLAIDPGTYLVRTDDNVVAPYTITVPAGWVTHYGDSVGKHQEGGSGAGHEQEAIGIEPFALHATRLTDDTCTGDETLGSPQTSTAGLVAALRAQGHGLQVSNPVATTVGGLPATRIDLDYPAAQPVLNCRLSTEPPHIDQGVLQVWSGYFVLFPDESASVYVVDVGGRAQVFVTRVADDASAADRAELQSILDSISFRTGAQ
jgi:hypothetical protein